ncbi:MAG TPA: phospholipase D-like domain-containing protein [Candidatus Saccharimonadales bacterium]
MRHLFQKEESETSGLLASKLYNDQSFYERFIKDLKVCHESVLIESPFMTLRRMNVLLPQLETLITRGIRVIVNTRDPHEHEDLRLASQAADAIEKLQAIDVLVLYTVGHHRKLSVIDNHILWEGSLNILSQNTSCEFMRRIDSPDLAKQTIDFIGLTKYIDF